MRAWVDGVVVAGGGAQGRDGLDAELSSGAGLAHPVAGVGDSVFTTALVVRGRVLGWRRHVARLASSVEALALPSLDEEFVGRACREVWAAGESLERARLRVVWGRAHDGSAHLSVRLSGLAEPEASVRVMTPSVRRTAGSLLSSHKTTVYAENLVAAAEARRAGAAEALLATTDGRLCEGTGTNVFYVVDGELRTPSMASGCLPGVARAVVLERCGAREVEEDLHVAHGAEEVFLTSSTREVQPVHAWTGRQYVAPGPVTRRVQEEWRRVCSDPDEWWALC